MIEAVLVQDLLDQGVASEVAGVAARGPAGAEGLAVAAKAGFTVAFGWWWSGGRVGWKVNFGELMLSLRLFGGRDRLRICLVW